MAIRVIAVPFEGRGLATYRLQAGEVFTVRTVTWTHRVVFDPEWADVAFPYLALLAQDGRRIAVVEAPSFKQLGTFPMVFGGIQPWPGSAVDRFGTPSGSQMVGALPDVLISAGCSIEVGATGTFGTPRTADLVTDLALTVSDTVTDELAAA